MLRTSENETEILLGNKQLLGIFFVAALLLGVAFAGGYKLGQSSAKKVTGPASAGAEKQTPSATSSGVGGETHSVAADSSGGTGEGTQRETSAGAESRGASVAPRIYAPPRGEDAEPPLGTPKHGRSAKPYRGQTTDAAAQAEPPSRAGFSTQPGDTFLQVAAVSRDEAEAIADVLHKKGFRAHAAPKPGSAKIYRVLIGPVRDAGDLSSTRESLRNTGFREIIVQRY